ncbi:MFS transporter [uncultured Deinococcus sp.]|uniref:MFS transporter n=1 Tax=uncultured Deinococcus sp. TaxID=158789 RepID=UPI0025D8E8EA|nr:MFS transporter [uncultured Deinococcus sp.]
MSTASRRPWPSLAGLPRNARSAIITEPLWAVFGVVVLYYAPLYMREVGLSSTEIGLVGSITLAVSFVFQILAAPVTNRLGRKRTTLVWDLVSWSVPMFVWAVSDSFAAFVVAGVLSATGRIVTVSWSLLVIEDVPQSLRARVFGILNLTVALCGLAAPLVGLVMQRYGVEPTMRVYYALGGVGMTVMFLWRNAITQETGTGQAAMLEHRDLHPWQSVTRTLAHVWEGRHAPGLPQVVAFYVLSLFLDQMSVFQILYFREALGFGVGTVSLLPVVTAAVTVLMYGLVLRRITHVPAERALVVTRVLGLLGAGALLLVPAGNVGALLAVVGVLAAAIFLTQTYQNAVLFARLPARGSADLYSGVQLLGLLGSIPAAGVAGVIYHAQPAALFVVIAVLNAALLGLAVVLVRGRPSGQGADS